MIIFLSPFFMFGSTRAMEPTNLNFHLFDNKLKIVIKKKNIINISLIMFKKDYVIKRNLIRNIEDIFCLSI